MLDNRLTIREVKKLKGLRAFINFPFSLYKDSPHWVPALRSDDLATFRSDKNPAFEFCRAKFWLAYRDGKIVGRVAGVINERHIEKWKHRYARFGIRIVESNPELENNLNVQMQWKCFEHRQHKRRRVFIKHLI